VLYAGQSRAGANRKHGCTRRTYGVQTVRYVFYDFVFLRSAVRYDIVPYGMVITAVRTVRFILLATLRQRGAKLQISHMNCQTMFDIDLNVERSLPDE
jgi:hypothetical protein